MRAKVYFDRLYTLDDMQNDCFANAYNSINELLQKETLNVHEMTSFMIYVRRIIEINNLSTTYRTLYFYTTWLVHGKIDRNSTMASMLSDINVIGNVNPDKNTINEFEDALRFQKLLQELGNFLSKECNIQLQPTGTFLCCLLQALMFIPLVFEVPTTKEVKDKVENDKRIIQQNINEVNTQEKYKDLRFDPKFDY